MKFMQSLPKVAVFGVGGVGGIVSASLQTAGKCALTCISRGNGLRTMQQKGLTVTLHEGTQINCQPDVIDTSETHSLGEQDYVFVGTKANDLAASLSSLEPLLGEKTMVIPLQNGIPHWFFDKQPGKQNGLNLKSVDGGEISRIVRRTNVLGCVSGHTMGHTMGHTIDTGFYKHWYMPTSRNKFVVGDPLKEGRDRILSKLFEQSRVPICIESTADIRTLVWDKLLINASINPLAAITKLDCGQLVDQPHTREMLTEVANEVTLIAQTLNPPIEPTINAEAIIQLYKNQYGLKPSMLQDVESGRCLETGPIIDSLLELGGILGVPTPTLETLSRILFSIQPKRPEPVTISGGHFMGFYATH